MAKRVHQPREDAEFDFILGMSGVPVLAYFIGTWPKAVEACRAMDLVVGGIADAYAGRLTVVRTDMTRCPAATGRYGVTGAPSCVLLKEGEAVAHGTGPMTTAEVRNLLAGHL
ncbi:MULTISPECIES: thioredoxin family protein [unclassified Streptomyces]|uniref:thioredoxin family protein n=1 Tax=unclassified Streptomyces TaxID=2593676 RepID=UPI0006AE1A3F|nr:MULTISPECIES: thioredoxin family protein [unclassified Streptomyces]KOX24699.1 thioredoxin [Streptomyces sp. NRRL F-6491]KOX38922.1 thioredoxin [Streptomyces sp. NRRL F-6492]